MFIFANLLLAVAQVLDYVFFAYFWILVGRIVVSLVRADFNNPIVRFLYAATEPVLERVRSRLPIAVIGGFDVSPIVVWLAVMFLQHFLVRSLYDLANTLR
jgi:YggT family protein